MVLVSCGTGGAKHIVLVSCGPIVTKHTVLVSLGLVEQGTQYW